MKQLTKHVIIKIATYNKLRRFLIDTNHDLVKGDICNAATEAIEQYIAKEKAEGD